MKNIFENAYFGKAYKTRDGRKAIYAGVLPSTTLHRLLIEGTTDTFNYNEFGEFKPYGSSVFDIVSEWQEEINEEELDKLAKEFSSFTDVNRKDIEWIFKAGYRKAKEM